MLKLRDRFRTIYRDTLAPCRLYRLLYIYIYMVRTRIHYYPSSHGLYNYCLTRLVKWSSKASSCSPFGAAPLRGKRAVLQTVTITGRPKQTKNPELVRDKGVHPNYNNNARKHLTRSHHDTFDSTVALLHVPSRRLARPQ